MKSSFADQLPPLPGLPGGVALKIKTSLHLGLGVCLSAWPSNCLKGWWGAGEDGEKGVARDWQAERKHA